MKSLGDHFTSAEHLAEGERIVATLADHLPKWTPTGPFPIGTEVTMTTRRTRRAIWWDRLRYFRWDVPLTQRSKFKMVAQGTTGDAT